MLITFCLTSSSYQNKGIRKNHLSCTVCNNVFYYINKQVVCHYTTVRDKIMYLPHNCKLSGNLLELEFCMLLGLSQFPCIFLFPVSVSLQGLTCHHGKPAISVYCIETLSQQDNYYCSHYSIQQYNAH